MGTTEDTEITEQGRECGGCWGAMIASEVKCVASTSRRRWAHGEPRYAGRSRAVPGEGINGCEPFCLPPLCPPSVPSHETNVPTALSGDSSAGDRCVSLRSTCRPARGCGAALAANTAETWPRRLFACKHAPTGKGVAAGADVPLRGALGRLTNSGFLRDSASSPDWAPTL